MAEIFHTHEKLNQDTRTPWMLRTLGASLVAHALFLASVVYVPAVRDAFSLASTLSGLRFVDEDYTQTAVIDRADVMLNFADNKLYYPPGYFSQTALPSPDAPQLVEEFRPRPVPTPKPVKVKPTPTPTPEASPSPDSAAAAGDETAAKTEGDKAGGDGGTPGASPSPAASPQTAEEAARLQAEAERRKFPSDFNLRPFTDLLKQGKQMKDAGEINLSTTLEMEFEANREKDGTLTGLRVTGDGSASNPKVRELAKKFVAAISASKLLAGLEGARHLKMKLKVNDKDISVNLSTEMASAESASLSSELYTILLRQGMKAKAGKDEEAIYKSVRIDSEAKYIVVSFEMPSKAAGDLLSKLIKKDEAAAPTATPPAS
ncbi:MAG TPA: hypothetical protein VEZ40_02195 [Pyrinomonadaceae bacterium]|nr:hypothetical protein [Pyrinomonadaceae bacterium]